MSFPIVRDGLRTDHNGWKVVKEGRAYTITRTVTLTATANQQVEIPFPLPGARSKGFQLNKVSIFYDDATAKDHEFRAYASESPNSYEAYMTKTTDTAQPHNAQFGVEYRYLTLKRLLFNWSNTTDGKTADITVTGEEF